MKWVTDVISERLKCLREERGYTQSELSELLLVGSQTQIWRWESGKQKPSLDALIRIAILFEVSTDYLLGLTDLRNSVCKDDLDLKEQLLINALRTGLLSQAFTQFSDIVNQTNPKLTR